MAAAKPIRRCFLKLGLGAVIAASLFAPTAAIAEIYYTSYAAAHNVSYTAVMAKNNSSKSYNYCTKVDYDATHTVEVVANVNDEIVFVGSPVYTWTPGKAGNLTNYVYENGARKAQLWFNNLINTGITIYGHFAADSYHWALNYLMMGP